MKMDTQMVIEARSNQSGPGNFLQFSHCKWNLCIRWVVWSPLIILLSIVTHRFRRGGLMLWFRFLGILLLPQWLWAGLQSLWDICPCPAILLQWVFFQGELTLLSPSEFLNVSTGWQSCRGSTGVKIRLLCQVKYCKCLRVVLQEINISSVTFCKIINQASDIKPTSTLNICKCKN